MGAITGDRYLDRLSDQVSANTIVQADLNGNNIADMQIVLTGLHPNLHAADFVL